MNLFSIGGIRLSLHFSFFLLLGVVAWEGASEAGWLGAAEAIGLVCAFFACVVLHELGHSAAAMRYGVRVPRILLMPIGGMAEFDFIPREPRKEIAIALAGPAVNYLILAVLWGFVDFPSNWESDPAWSGHNGFLLQLFLANLAMGTFNLLPAFPMDGGRVLRALLAYRLSYLKATYLAALTGKIIAACGILAALWFHLWMPALLLLFIFVVGEAEYRGVKRAEAEAQHWREFWERQRQLSEDKPQPPPETPAS